MSSASVDIPKKQGRISQGKTSEAQKRAIKNWRLRNPEKYKTYLKDWQKKNPEKVKQNCKNWRKRHPEKIRENAKKWRLMHPEEAKAKQKIRAKKRYEKIKTDPELLKKFKERIAAIANKPEVKEKRRAKQRLRYQTESEFRARKIKSVLDSQRLRKNGGS